MRSTYPRSTNPLYFIAAVIAAAMICIGLPLALTHGHTGSRPAHLPVPSSTTVLPESTPGPATGSPTAGGRTPRTATSGT